MEYPSGQYVLLTNADIILSDELVAFIADRKLEEGVYYRADRHDLSKELPDEISSVSALFIGLFR